MRTDYLRQSGQKPPWGVGLTVMLIPSTSGQGAGTNTLQGVAWNTVDAPTPAITVVGEEGAPDKVLGDFVS